LQQIFLVVVEDHQKSLKVRDKYLELMFAIVCLPNPFLREKYFCKS
jgi:hypothetical protein